MQNNYAVMSQRVLPGRGLDDFPTPPWAVRALVEHVIGQPDSLRHLSSLEPACGRGHTADALAEYFGSVDASDIHPYGFGAVDDFTVSTHADGSFDWVITNPPFRLAEAFILRALPIARRGVAMLSRTVFVEGIGRHHRLYAPHPPSKVAQFTERVPMIQGRLDRKASTATGYAWLVWEKDFAGATQFCWIPPCRKQLERDDDYLPTGHLLSGSMSEVDNEGAAA
jgi:hypothetical protein